MMFAHFVADAPSLTRTARTQLKRALLFSLLVLLLLILTAPPVHAASILRVKPTGADSASCETWATACSLQHALSIAGPGKEIWVMKGTYKPTTGTDRNITFQLKNGVAIYGGFAGTETLRDKRNWKLNITALSGDIGVTGNATDNSYHVVTGSLTDSTAVLDGFTIKAGNADGAGCAGPGCGGGMLNAMGSPTLSNLIFNGNSAAEYGGAIYNDHSNSTLTNVTFTNNIVTDGHGGGMYNVNSDVNLVLSNVTFTGNKATGSGKYGGGMANLSCKLTLTNVTFSNNTSDDDGGGMYNASATTGTLTNITFTGNKTTGTSGNGAGMYNSTSSPSLTNVKFINNTSASYGGGMANASSDPILTNVTFSGNRAADNGGGMNNSNSSPSLTNVTFSSNTAAVGGGLSQESSSPTLTNVTFSTNTAVYGGGMQNGFGAPTLLNVTFSGNTATGDGDSLHGGGGLYNNSSSPTLTNVTFSGNKATGANSSGGGIYNFGGLPQVRNAILWGNTALNGPQVYVNAGTPGLSDSIVQDGYPGGTNILTGNPKLVPLASNGGYTKTHALGAGSSAINAGNIALCPATDQRGLPRRLTSPSDTTRYCDIGAFEAQPKSVIAAAGTTQSAHVYNSFPRYLVAKVRDAYLNLLGGVPVTFYPAASTTAPLPRFQPDTNYSDGTGQAWKALVANGTLGTYKVTARVAGVTTPATFTLTNVATMENDYRGIVYDNWYATPSVSASGGIYRYTVMAGATVTYKFNGLSTQWITREGPLAGATHIHLDGADKGEPNHYAASYTYNVAEPIIGTVSSAHTVELIKVNADGRQTVVDAFKVGATTIQEDSIKVQYGSWAGYTNSAASSGNYRASIVPGAFASLKLTGTSFIWVTTTGPGMGTARVTIDALPPQDINLYSATTKWKAPITFSGLSDIEHDIRIEVLSTKDPASSGYMVVVDAFK